MGFDYYYDFLQVLTDDVEMIFLEKKIKAFRNTKNRSKY